MTKDQPTAPNPAPSAVEGSAPNQRTFSLNSREFYEAVTEPPTRGCGLVGCRGSRASAIGRS